MIDSIGLGNAIANFIYLILVIALFWGFWFFIKKRNVFGVIFWISSILNFFFYMFLMGNYRFYPKYFYPIVNKYWPLINLGLFVLLIILYRKQKKKMQVSK